jgi:hypothetical protein
MTLVVASLDVTLDSRIVRKLVSDLMLRIIKDRTTRDEVLIHGLNKHIEGWRSAGCVRGISVACRDVWNRLLLQGKHPSGNIPESDAVEILRLLFWIATGQDNRFDTASTDVFCLAEILAEIGLDQLITTTNIEEKCDESRLLVVLNASHVRQLSGLNPNIWRRRRGMRIPLNELEESVFMWAGDTTEGNMRRDIFSSGMRAGSNTKLVVVPRKTQTLYAMNDKSLDVYYVVESNTQETLQRLDKNVYRLLDGLFLESTPETASSLQNLVRRWPSDNISAIGWWLKDVRPDDDTEVARRFLDLSATKDLSHLIIFVLGYYYAVLKPLLNTTQLVRPEAIGSWGCDDIQVLTVLRRFKLSADADNEGRFARHEVLRLLGYMFAGASWRSLSAVI